MIPNISDETELASETVTPTHWLPSKLKVAALLAFHQCMLTTVHYIILPKYGIDPQNAEAISTTIILAAVLIFLVAAFDARNQNRSQALLLSMPKWTWSTFAKIVVGMAVAQIPLAILALERATVWQTPHPSDLGVAHALAKSANGASMTLLASTILVAPLVEEILYRGYLIGAISRSAPQFVVVLISALLFVTLHFETTNLLASFCLGLGAALCAIRTRSIVPGLIVHIANNAFGMWYTSLG